jgi:hypothetical protein
MGTYQTKQQETAMLGTAEHYLLMEQFEKDFQKSFRLDREDKSLWPKGHRRTG